MSKNSVAVFGRSTSAALANLARTPGVASLAALTWNDSESVGDDLLRNVIHILELRSLVVLGLLLLIPVLLSVLAMTSPASWGFLGGRGAGLFAKSNADEIFRLRGMFHDLEPSPRPQRRRGGFGWVEPSSGKRPAVEGLQRPSLSRRGGPPRLSRCGTR